MKIKNFYKALIALVLTVCLAFSLTACGGSSEIEVKSLTLDRAGLALDVGGEATLSALVMPSEAASGVTWLSSDPAVATVNGGKVKGIGEGTAIIRAVAGGKYDDCAVTVTDPSKADVPATGVTLDNVKLSMSVGDTEKLTATVSPENATIKTVTWTSTNPSVATVDSNGEITAVAAGKTVIKVTTHNNYSAVCNVTVSGDSGSTNTSSLYVKKVNSLSTRTEKFIMGMDASAVPSIEAAHATETDETGVLSTYKNFKGEYEDVYKILAANGITDIRIRVWNDPTDGNGNSYGGGNCDIDNAVAIARRCQAAGLGVIIDFHYSDFWADPSKQTRPKAWADYDETQVAQAIYDFTYESLGKIKETGVKITMVQVGNETTNDICGANRKNETATYCNYINKGAAAVRAATGAVADGGAKVAVHFTNPDRNWYLGIAKNLNDNNVDYDVFGSSYYPFWHGTLSNLSSELKGVHDTYGKEVMVLETSYGFADADFDGAGGTSGAVPKDLPFTVQSQSNQIRNVIETVANLGDYGLGVCYWEGTWIAASTSTDGATNRELCRQYGCGWASRYAYGYDEGVTSATADGGCVMDNQVFWMSDGTVLESLKVFSLVYEGQTQSLAADYLYDQEGYCTVNDGTLTMNSLPATVSVVLNNALTTSVTAYWNEVTAEQLAEYNTTVGQYKVEGTTEYGGTCYYTIWVLNPNLLDDGGFEDSNGYADSISNFIKTPESGHWKLNSIATTAEAGLYVCNAGNNAEMGTNSFHFWDSAAINFTLSQTVDLTKLSGYGNGKYCFSFDVQGGTCGATQEFYAYVKLTTASGEQIVKGSSVATTVWSEWFRSSVEFDYDESVTKIEVFVYAKAEANGWGNIDNCQFYFVG